MKSVKALALDEDEIQEIEREIAYAPETGDVVEGTGGIRKRRISLPGRQKGKSGGGRGFTLFMNYNAPVYIITLLDKSDNGNLSKVERNALAALAETLKSAMRRKMH